MNRLLIAATLTLFISSPCVQAGEKSAAPHIVGHRGLIHHAPENTLAGFAACLELRLGFEVDVRRSKDGHLVCVHDETVDRTTNGKGKVCDLTLAELHKLDAGSRFHPAFARERVPTLDEVLALLQKRHGDLLIALDIKEEDLEEDLVKLVQKHKLAGQVICIGLTIERPAMRKKLRSADAKIGIAALAQTGKDVGAALRDPSANWTYVRFVPTVSEVIVMHDHGKKVFIAGPTVAGHEAENWGRCRSASVDAVLTDFPLECRKSWK